MSKANINKSPENGALHSEFAAMPKPITKIMKETS